MLSKKGTGYKYLLKGIPASPGIAIGKAFLLSGDVIKIEERKLLDSEVPEEIDKFKRAVETARNELKALKTKAVTKLGQDSARIFDAHQMLLEDSLIIDETIKTISTEKKNADLVFYERMRKYQETLDGMDDDYLRSRVSDLKDVKRRVIRHIQGEQVAYLSTLSEPAVIIARDLTPSETVLLDRRKILAFATDWGGKTSHVAIMARSLEIPSVVGLHNLTELIKSGDRIIVDGLKGEVIIGPSQRTLQQYRRLVNEYYDFERKLADIRELPCRTLDGKDIELSANLEFPDEVESVISHGAKGIGLYRTEYLYLAKKELPTEEEQYQEYRQVAERIYPDPVIIRTLDLGGDKSPRCINIPHEENPFLGWRAIRICLKDQNLFKAQLRAILRASALGNVKIMYPMISCLKELCQCQQILEGVKSELRKKRVPFDEHIEVGVMIEVPSAAIMADVIAEKVNFLSIGTNDLIQYTLAVDRGNEKIAYLYQPIPPSVLKLIKRVVDEGHKKGIWVGMCGEMAGDPLATLILVGLGLDELSVSPIVLPEIKKIIRSITYTEAVKLAEHVLDIPTAEEIERFMTKIMRRKFKDIPF